jgi:hypothetical protein
MATESCGQQQPAATLLTRSRWVRFELVLGRITLLTLSCGPRRIVEGGDAAEGVNESLTFNGEPESPSLVYQRQDGRRQLKIIVSGRTAVSIFAAPCPDEPGESLRFTQQADGRVTLIVGQRTYAAESVWHLLLTAPETPRQQLVMLLQAMRSDWQVDAVTEQVQSALVQDTAAKPVAHATIRALVAQLDSPNFPTRRAADRRLRDLGLPALPYLEQLDASRLSGEQRLRIRQLRADLRSITPDTPDRVALWLRHDESLWKAWLTQPGHPRHKAASQGIAALRRTDVPTSPPRWDATPRHRVAALPGGEAERE